MPLTSNKDLTLFIFEGAKTEEKLVNKLEQNFLGDRHAIKCVFEAEVYQLYESINDEGPFQLDIVSVLKERTSGNADELKYYTRDSFAYVYLFFDYDAHSTLADDEKIKVMLSFFDNETENGKLYISYPMVEAIRHYKDMESFKELTVKCKRDKCPFIVECADKDTCLNEPHYKTVVSSESLPQLSNLNGYTKTVWQNLIMAHLCKMNYLVNGRFEFPNDICPQSVIFSKQIEKHISQRCPTVAVLSAIPVYVLDYYGCSRLLEKLREE